MDEFSYLSVLIAIILGLAITQILQGFRGLLHFRDQVVIYWPSLAWACRMRQAGSQGCAPGSRAEPDA